MPDNEGVWVGIVDACDGDGVEIYASRSKQVVLMKIMDHLLITGQMSSLRLCSRRWMDPPGSPKMRICSCRSSTHGRNGKERCQYSVGR